MPALTLAEMLAAESLAISRGWTEEQLLDEAGRQLGLAIGRHFPTAGTVIAYLGKGHNAGDAVVALGVLRERFGWEIGVRHAFASGPLAPLLEKKCAALGPIRDWQEMPDWQSLKRPVVLLDGLLGCGGKGPLRGAVLESAAEIEWLRQNTGARVVAVDLPSGVDPDTGRAMPGAVHADLTFMIGHAKHGLLLGTAANHTGALALVPLDLIPPPQDPPSSDLELISPQNLHFGKSPRPFDFHKGMAGRVSVVAGSRNYPGAAVIAATGALRGGAGLITLHVPANARLAIAARCPAEIIVKSYRSLSEIRDTVCDSWVIGCGLGPLAPAEFEHLWEILSTHPSPAVLDADALNAIAVHGTCKSLQKRHVITPHPGEFRRLAPDLADLDREQAAREFVKTSAATLLLKGSRTLVTRAGSAVWCNSTGGPSMASGGQGDLLAGVIGARLAAGMDPMEAAAHSAWVCGRAAEIAVTTDLESDESLTPQDVSHALGRAFNDWRSSGR